jgi:hypothetical protein
MPSADIATIAALGASVLCLDTCSVLDQVRDPTRDSVRAHERQAALDLLGIAEAGKQLVALIADQVTFEFAENLKPVEDEARAALLKLKDRLVRIDAVAAVYGTTGLTNVSHLDDHVARARTTVDRWMTAANLVRKGPDVPGLALDRLNRARTPARRGKDSMKDCVVIETYLESARELRAAGLSQPIVFVSSNTKDYCTETGSALRTDLASEFAALNIEYAPNFAAAKHLLGLSI